MRNSNLVKVLLLRQFGQYSLFHVALYVTHLFPSTRRWSNQAIRSIVSSFTAPVFALSRRAYSIVDLLILGALLFGVIIVAGIFTNALRSRVVQRAGISCGLQEVIAMLTKYAVVTIATIVLLQIWGFDLSSLTILASALGIGIGFGLQDIAKNFGSGLVLVFERPIQVGDFVEVEEFKGTIERIGARSTEIRALDHVSIIVPNSRLLEKEVINWSRHNPISRLHIPAGVAYNSKPKTVQTALLEAAQNRPDVLQSSHRTSLLECLHHLHHEPTLCSPDRKTSTGLRSSTLVTWSAA